MEKIWKYLYGPKNVLIFAEYVCEALIKMVLIICYSLNDLICLIDKHPFTYTGAACRGEHYTFHKKSFQI